MFGGPCRQRNRIKHHSTRLRQNERTTINGKYAPLFHHLTALSARRWCATFAEIESILGFSLPNSARAYEAWWANQHNGNHSQARAWQAAGWRVRAVSLREETVGFERHNSAARTASYRPRRPPRRPTPQADACGPTETLTAGGGTTTLGGRAFKHVARITPEARLDGKPVEETPHLRYDASKPLNRHGKGPFCRFKVPGLPETPGVYAVTVARKLVYVGISKTSLKQRWGPSGYAQVQPINCFKGGQSTNCKVNHAILVAARDKLAVDLWIHRTRNPRPLEARLIRDLTPPWNNQR